MRRWLRIVSFFTYPYEDEILYSAVARYHYYSGNRNFKVTLGELFGSSTTVPSLLFPCRLKYFSSQISESETKWEEYLVNNTMFPFYAPFLPERRAKEIKMAMKEGSGNGIYTKVGYVAGGICKSDGLKYCPTCVIEDVRVYGEPYFHRVHQLQGVFVCPEHYCLLKEYPVKQNDYSRVGFIRLVADALDLAVEQESQELLSKQLISIAKSVNSLAKLPLNYNVEWVNQVYIALLNQRGLVTIGGHVRQRELFEEIRNYYTEDTLLKLESLIDYTDSSNWLQMATRKPRRVLHPLRHLLIIIYLCGSVEELFKNIPVKQGPFGNGPWNCLNPVADHYKQPVITKCEVTPDYKTRVPVGTFSCSCGFVFSRKGPDMAEEDKFKIGRIKQFGDIWETKLHFYIKQGVNGLRELARKMKCDPKTILKFAERFDLLSSLNTAYKSGTKFTKSKSKDGNSEAIKTLCSNKSPVSKHIKVKLRVDWENRDNKILKELQNIKTELLLSPKPRRITKSLLGRSIGKLPLLEHYIDKMPKAKSFLIGETESVDDFQRRRIDIVYNKYLNRGVQLKDWELARIAGLRKDSWSKVNSFLKGLE